MNNIFDYATGELSQDAFICWLVNWFNDDTKPRLKELSKRLIHSLIDDEKYVIKTVDIIRQFSRKVDEKAVKIDVLVIVNNTVAIIIEDKTFTSEHDDQIDRYKSGLDSLVLKEGKLQMDDGKQFAIQSIKTVYWKTGYVYDGDIIAGEKADKRMYSDELLRLLSEYKGESEILDSYIESQENLKEWYCIHSDYWKPAYKDTVESVWDTNLCNHQIAQFTLMCELFPEGEGAARDIRCGSSFGRPWTEKWIKWLEEKKLGAFWRIDTDNKGSYISLRLYKAAKGAWDDNYQRSLEAVRSYIDEKKYKFFNWDDVYPGKKSNYKEAAIFQLYLNSKKPGESELWANNRKDIITLVADLSNNIENVLH